MGTYAYDQAWEDERDRLAGIERLWDEGTIALFEQLGVGPGSAVAEVGAGGGSMVQWLGERVGPSGRVLAADVYTKFIEPLAGGPIEVTEHDILAAPLPEGEFDFVHARLLVEHIGFGALPNMIAGLRPGGVLLLEDYDFGCRGWEPDTEVATRVTDAVLQLMSGFGFDPACGRRLPLRLEEAGLTGVEAAGRVRLIRGATPETAFFRLSLQTLREQILATGRASDDEVGEVVAGLDDPALTALSPVLIACRGTRAA